MYLRPNGRSAEVDRCGMPGRQSKSECWGLVLPAAIREKAKDMTYASLRSVGWSAAVASTLCIGAATARAQCSTCATPTVAYSPVTYAAPAAVATTVAYQPTTGWYPGRFFDRLRMRRWGATEVAAAPVYTAAYAPYTAAYAPSYTAAYAPSYTSLYAPTYTAAYAPTYTAAYAPAAAAPYVTAYAPLSRPVVQTSYYAPTTVYSPAALSPVIETPLAVEAAPACAPACAACPGTTAVIPQTSVVEQAGYVQPAAAPCSGCASSSAVIDYGTPAPAAAAPSSGPFTGVPELPSTGAPTQSNYPAKSDNGEKAAENPSTTPGPAEEDEIEPQADPNASFDAPMLLKPNPDRTANRPTVDIHQAVYRQPVRTSAVSATAEWTSTTPSLEAGAEGWVSVPRN